MMSMMRLQDIDETLECYRCQYEVNVDDGDFGGVL